MTGKSQEQDSTTRDSYKKTVLLNLSTLRFTFRHETIMDIQLTFPPQLLVRQSPMSVYLAMPKVLREEVHQVQDQPSTKPAGLDSAPMQTYQLLLMMPLMMELTLFPCPLAQIHLNLSTLRMQLQQELFMHFRKELLSVLLLEIVSYLVQRQMLLRGSSLSLLAL